MGCASSPSSLRGTAGGVLRSCLLHGWQGLIAMHVPRIPAAVSRVTAPVPRVTAAVPRVTAAVPWVLVPAGAVPWVTAAAIVPWVPGAAVPWIPAADVSWVPAAATVPWVAAAAVPWIPATFPQVPAAVLWAKVPVAVSGIPAAAVPRVPAVLQSPPILTYPALTRAPVSPLASRLTCHELQTSLALSSTLATMTPPVLCTRIRGVLPAPSPRGRRTCLRVRPGLVAAGEPGIHAAVRQRYGRACRTRASSRVRVHGGGIVGIGLPRFESVASVGRHALHAPALPTFPALAPLP